MLPLQSSQNLSGHLCVWSLASHCGSEVHVERIGPGVEIQTGEVALAFWWCSVHLGLLYFLMMRTGDRNLSGIVGVETQKGAVLLHALLHRQPVWPDAATVLGSISSSVFVREIPKMVRGTGSWSSFLFCFILIFLQNSHSDFWTQLPGSSAWPKAYWSWRRCAWSF